MTTSHYFDPNPTAASRTRRVRLPLEGIDLELETDRAVFSRLSVDRGTQLLLETAPRPPAEGEVLDLGCGYGPIALALAARAPGARIWAVDVNLRALDLVRRNAAAARLPNVVAAHPDDVPEATRFAAIYSNPPVRIGKAALHQLLLRWLDRLEPQGRAYLVVQRYLGSDSLARWLGEQGCLVRRLRSRTGYRVLEAEPRVRAAPSTKARES